jgi:hypothetical protein
MSVVYVYPKCPAGNSEGHWLSALHRFASVCRFRAYARRPIETMSLAFRGAGWGWEPAEARCVLLIKARTGGAKRKVHPSRGPISKPGVRPGGREALAELLCRRSCCRQPAVLRVSPLPLLLLLLLQHRVFTAPHCVYCRTPLLWCCCCGAATAAAAAAATTAAAAAAYPVALATTTRPTITS